MALIIDISAAVKLINICLKTRLAQQISMRQKSIHGEL